MKVICVQSGSVDTRRGAARGLAGVAAGAIALALVAASLVGCSPTHTRSPDGVLRIVAGFYPLQYLAEQVGGAQVRVTNLAQPGVEPHDLELSPRQVADVADADLVLYLKGFQPALDEATRLEAPSRSFDVAGAVTLLPAVAAPDRAGDSDPDEATAGNGADPHVWLDPRRFAQVALGLADRLGAIDPAGAAGYRQRSGVLQAELANLDQAYRSGLNACRRHEIVVSHAAFGYLAQRYGLSQIAISGLSPDAEPAPQRLAAVAAQARQHNATTIFFETLASPKVAQVIAAEVGAATAVLDPIEGLPPGSVDTYLSVMRVNLATLRGALGCT